MGFDSVLNIVWALVGVVGLTALAVSERRRYASSLRSRCRRGMAVVIATVALFPCISASDDLVCLEQVHFGYATHASFANPRPEQSNRGLRPDLAVLLGSLENFQISTASPLFVTLYSFARVRPQPVQGCERPLPARAERGPPQLALAL